jgi:hypothetical protein
MKRRRAIYRPPTNFLWTLFAPGRSPPPTEVEFLEWAPEGMARVRLEVSEQSLLGIYAKHQGKPLPPPVERLVPAECLTLLDAS